ncbi:hypothetical protein HN51_070620, partial [Arachis hypogaea]
LCDFGLSRMKHSTFLSSRSTAETETTDARARTTSRTVEIQRRRLAVLQFVQNSLSTSPHFPFSTNGMRASE